MNNDIFTQMGNFISDKIKIFINTLDFSHYPLIILDILIVAALFYWIYILIKGTKGMRILIGLMFLAVSLFASRLLGFLALTWVLTSFLAVAVIAIPIIFQPELRRALERLGRTDIWNFFKEDKELKGVVSEICEAARVLAKNKIGALIIIKRRTGLEDYIETGTLINAQVSSKIILNIFFPHSPLHDGAVIIEGSKVIAAGCTLPLSETDQSFKYGTRHKAALGISAETDVVVVVVSEEKGTIAFAADGKLIPKVSKDDLEQHLIKILKLDKKYLNKFKNAKKNT